jgi:glycosyltransferase involved in cell wall biosynthesis
MKVTLLQTGARHNYAMARFLAEDGVLQRLYTDWAFGDGGLSAFIPSLLSGSRWAGKLERRTANGIPAARIACSLARWTDDRVGERRMWSISKADIAQSDVFYAQYFCGASGLKDHLRADQAIISDVFTVPSTHLIVNAEAELHPEWGEPTYSPEAGAGLDYFNRRMVAESDFLFCPSTSVVDDVKACFPEASSKVRLVPYGSSISFDRPASPVVGRILFVGALTLRKGPQYLGMVARRLARSHPSIHFVFAGSVSDQVRKLMDGPNVTLLGQISRSDLEKQYLMADAYAFPSLAEGAAGSALEAMAAGLPLIATRSSGMDFTHEKEGLVVPERDDLALEAAIVRVVQDRDLRASLSQGAKQATLAYNFDRWRANYVGAIASALHDKRTPADPAVRVQAA